METLPNEIILDITTNLTGFDCLNLVKASKRYLWLFREKSLWQSFASRDLRYPEEFFEQHLDQRNPAQVYADLSQCQHYDKIKDTIFRYRCRRKVFPGAPYCEEHCIFS